MNRELPNDPSCNPTIRINRREWRRVTLTSLQGRAAIAARAYRLGGQRRKAAPSV